MSLSAPVPPPRFRVAIFAATSLEDPDFISTHLGENIAAVSHIYTNGANDLVTRFAASHGVPFTTYPLTGGGSLPASTNAILDTVDFAYVIADESSKSAKLVVETCEKKEIKYKIVRFDPVDYWKLKVCKIREILEGATKEDVAASVHLQSVKKVVG